MKTMRKIYGRCVLLLICPPDKPLNRCKELINISCSIICIIILFTSMIASIVYVKKYFSTDLASAICAVSQICGIVVGFYSLITAYIKRNDIKEIFDDFQAFYDANKHLDPRKYMVKAEQQATLCLQLFEKIILFPSSLSVIGNCATYFLYNKWKFGEIDEENLYHAHRLVLPWNQQTIPGWIADAVFTMLDIFVATFIYEIALLFFVTICNYHWAFYKMFQLQITKIDEAAASKRFADVKELLNKSISFHVSAKELFHPTVDVNSEFILIQLIGTMGFLACCIFEIDLALHDLSRDTVLMIFAVTFSLLVLYLYCYYGKLVTDSYAAFGNRLYESKWYNLPMNLQKYYTLMIGHSQIPLFYHGCGVVNLDLELFLRIIKTAVTYYMMFKTLTKA